MTPCRRLLSCAVVLWAGALPAQAASDGFTDCAKAEKADEKTICADIRLVQEDARMVTLYKVATGLVGMGVRGDLQDSQVAWLDLRHACRDDGACLRAAYAKRIERLQSVIDGVASHGPF